MTDQQPTPPPSAPQHQPGQHGGYGQAPQYGQAYGQQPYGQPDRSDKFNVLAIVSLVSAFFISLVAVITGHIALHQIKRTGEQGRALAITGLVLGYLGLLAGIIIVIIVFAALAMHSGEISTF